MRVAVIRHARTRWNDAKRLQGWVDTEPYPEALTSFWERTQDIPFGPDVVFSSDLKRARVSAQMFLQRYGDVPVIYDWRLRERHMGEWEGRYSQEIKEKHPEVLRVDFRIPGGESVLDVYERVSRFAGDMVWYSSKRGWTKVFIVSHQITMEVLRRVLLGIPVDQTVWENLRGSGDWFEVEVGNVPFTAQR